MRQHNRVPELPLTVWYNFTSVGSLIFLCIKCEGSKRRPSRKKKLTFTERFSWAEWMLLASMQSLNTAGGKVPSLPFSRWGIWRSGWVSLPKAAWSKQSGQVQPWPQLPLSLWSLPAPKCSPTPRNCNYHGLGPDQSQRVSGHSSKDQLHEWDMRSQFQRTGWDQLKLENLHITCECDLKNKKQKHPDTHTKTCFHPLLKVMEQQ